MMPKIARELSAIEVSRLAAPGFISVGVVPGLAMQIGPGGAKSWILRVKVGTKRRDMGLGAYPAVSLARARERAREARASIEQGVDPVLTRQRAQSQLRAAQASAITFEDAAHRFIESKSAGWGGTKSLSQWNGSLKNYAYPVIGKLHVQDVTLTHILEILTPIWTTKTETASRLRGRIESVLDWATVSKHRTGENPARWRGHLDKLLSAPSATTTVVHYAAVAIDDATEFYKNLQTREGTAARALEFAMLTAARPSEATGATWSEIDLEKSTWTIPAARMKASREHRVPLTEAAIEILAAMPRLEGGDLVFFAPRGGQLSDMALTSVMRRMGLREVPHGLRSTFKDWASERTHFPGDMSEMALAHALPSATMAAYQRGTMFEKRRAIMQAWAEFLSTPTTHEGDATATPTR